jgi:hypothetical protein
MNRKDERGGYMMMTGGKGQTLGWLIGLVGLLVGLLGGCQTVVRDDQALVPTIAPTTLAPVTPSFEPTAALATAVPPTTEPESPTPTEEIESESMNQANADVIFVRAVQTGEGIWTFHVTVEHPDTGWEDYANGWDVVLPEGTAVKPDPNSQFTRLLLHPHETEQPFTRSQSGIEIPPDVTEVIVRAHDLVDGFGGQEVLVDLTAESGENFEVEK